VATDSFSATSNESRVTNDDGLGFAVGDCGERCLCDPEIVCGGEEDWQAADSRGDRDRVETFDALVGVHRVGLLGGERGDSAADVAGELLQVFYGNELNFTITGSGGECLQVQLCVARNRGHADAVPVTLGDQRFEKLPGGRPILAATASAARSSGSTSYSRNS
jgi:hypothetical protein